jgi:hypothetical protein
MGDHPLQYTVTIRSRVHHEIHDTSYAASGTGPVVNDKGLTIGIIRKNLGYCPKHQVSAAACRPRDCGYYRSARIPLNRRLFISSASGKHRTCNQCEKKHHHNDFLHSCLQTSLYKKPNGLFFK